MRENRAEGKTGDAGIQGRGGNGRRNRAEGSIGEEEKQGEGKHRVMEKRSTGSIGVAGKG